MLDVISVKNMRESDEKIISEALDNDRVLMWKAALGVFNNVSWKGKIAIVTGKGNNGGDGYALSLILKEHNIDSTIIEVADEVSLSASYYYYKARDNGIKHISIKDIDSLSSFDIIVDAIFGTGFNSIPKGEYKRAIELINNSGAYVVSVDINSGLNGDNGLGEIVVKSNKTISIGQYKFGHFLNMAKDVMDEVINVDIGIPPLKKEGLLLEEKDVASVFKKRKNLSNKGSYGYVGILGGSSKYIGAVKLAHLGQEALYAGAGVSKVIVPSSIKDYLYPHVLESTIFPLSSNNEGDMIFNETEIKEAIRNLKALGVGIGWGVNEENQKILKYILENYDGALVIDADGLNVLSLIGLDYINKSKAKIILTPHLKEFSRLSNLDVKYIEEHLYEVSREFVNQYDVTLLLKGPTTLVSNRKATYFINRGTPGMASAGSGDVLTGILVGILGYYREDVTFGAAISAYINGMSGEMASKEYGDIGMVSSDTLRNVSKVLKRLELLN